MLTKVDWTNKQFSYDRNVFRKEVIEEFTKELPGTGKGEQASKYEYCVLKQDTFTVVLKRPAQFNHGFDFTLHVIGMNFNPTGRSTTRPAHPHILEDLKKKKEENIEKYQLLLRKIENIFHCTFLDNNIQINFENGLPTNILLECIKWLFLEQDITYWNYSGRSMLYDSIKSI